MIETAVAVVKQRKALFADAPPAQAAKL